jgi:hypothetical protein
MAGKTSVAKRLNSANVRVLKTISVEQAVSRVLHAPEE